MQIPATWFRSDVGRVWRRFVGLAPLLALAAGLTAVGAFEAVAAHDDRKGNPEVIWIDIEWAVCEVLIPGFPSHEVLQKAFMGTGPNAPPLMPAYPVAMGKKFAKIVGILKYLVPKDGNWGDGHVTLAGGKLLLNGDPITPAIARYLTDSCDLHNQIKRDS